MSMGNMYNFAAAFVICAAIYWVGEFVGAKTKAWIPSVFVSAVIFLVGYWTIFPNTLVSDSYMIPFGSTIGIYLLISHMGSVISIKQLIEQWKTVVVCLVGLTGMCLLCFLFQPVIGQEYILAGLPPLTGGIIAATTMQTAAQEAGLEMVAVFAIAIYCVQGFAGYPLTAYMLKWEGKRLLTGFHAGKVEKVAVSEGGSTVRKKLLPPVPDQYNTVALILVKLGVISWLAIMTGKATGVSGAVWALIIGVIATTIGFLDENALGKANSSGIIMFAIMLYVFNGLKDCTAEMLLGCIKPMIILIVVGVLGMALFCFVIAKILKISFPMAFATALTALYGFPPNAIITEESCNAVAKTAEEKEYLMSHMMPQMLVGGFTTVTITSVIIAGMFADILIKMYS